MKEAGARLGLATRCWLVAAILVGGGFFLGRLAETPWRSPIRGWDNSFYYFWLRSAMEDGDWDFANEIAENNTVAPKDRETSAELPPTDEELPPNKYGIGWGLTGVPWYFAAEATVVISNRVFGTSWTSDGWSPPYAFAMQIGQLCYAIIGLWALCRCLRRWSSRDTAWRAVAIAWLATPLLYYQASNLSMSHSLVFTLSALCFAVAVQFKNGGDRPRNWVLFGALVGCSLITRPVALLGFVPAIWIAGKILWSQPRREALLNMGRAAAATVPFLALQAWAWKCVYGRWIVFGYGQQGEGFQWSDPQWAEVMISPFHGALYWHPVFLLSAAGCGFAMRRKMDFDWVMAIGVSVLLTWFVYACWWVPSLGASFGYRGFDSLWVYAIFGLNGLLVAVAKNGRLKPLLEGVAVAFCVWNFLICLAYAVGTMERNEPVTYPEMLQAICDLPKVDFSLDPPERAP